MMIVAADAMMYGKAVFWACICLALFVAAAWKTPIFRPFSVVMHQGHEQTVRHFRRAWQAAAYARTLEAALRSEDDYVLVMDHWAPGVNSMLVGYGSKLEVRLGVFKEL